MEINTLLCVPASSTTTYVGLPPTVQWRMVETLAVGDTSWSGHQVGQDMITEGNHQYIAYYDADRRMAIGYRTLDSSSWQLYKIPGDEAVLNWDSHNYVRIALDRTGHLHVSGNLHVKPLRYWRTTIAGDITSLEKVNTMVDSAKESSVTYPIFFKDINGDLIFTYRDGGSGAGDNYFNKYNAATKTWSALISSSLFDGNVGTIDRSSYYNLSTTQNARGYYEMTWMWRDTPDVETNSRLCYARSRDLLQWETVAGTPITLPITYATPGVIVDDVPERGGLFNKQETIGYDTNGNTLISYHKYDENGTNQIYVARPNGSGGWSSTKITRWTGRWEFSGRGTLTNRITARGVQPIGNGALSMNFTCNAQAGRTEATIILDNDMLAPIAQIPTYNPYVYPSSLYVTTSTTPPSATRLVANVVDDTTRYFMKWQSQGNNADKPFPSWPDAQPLYIYRLAPVIKKPPYYIWDGVAYRSVDLRMWNGANYKPARAHVWDGLAHKRL